MVVSLSADGHLLCSYMGTDPSFFSTPKVDAREADYQQVEAEMRKLQKFIREASRTQGWSKHLQQVFARSLKRSPRFNRHQSCPLVMSQRAHFTHMRWPQLF